MFFLFAVSAIVIAVFWLGVWIGRHSLDWQIKNLENLNEDLAAEYVRLIKQGGTFAALSYYAQETN